MPPPSPESERAAAADRADCATLLRGGSRTFFAASFLLPRAMRGPATALYAFCRLADDAVDLEGGGREALEPLRERLARIYQGRPLPIAADRAFAEVVVRYAIPRALPEALLEGFEWDAAGRRYEDLAALQAYAARVAGAVGAMMSLLMGARAPDVVARACDLGVAMQLTNIARDVGEDARAGRLYLPLQWLREAGVDPDAWLARPEFDRRVAAVVERVLRAADVLYERAGRGIARLPLTCRPGIQAARVLYAEIGREVERRGLDSVSARAVVPARRKAGLLPIALVAAVLPARREVAPALAETRFLVDAVAASTVAVAPARGASRRTLEERAIWVIELFERLERSDRQALANARASR
jgi:15-cis-phytoene synthase